MEKKIIKTLEVFQCNGCERLTIKPLREVKVLNFERIENNPQIFKICDKCFKIIKNNKDGN